MKTPIRIQLSTMMFLNYFVWGAWYVTVGTYMSKSLGFSGVQIGSVYATNAIAAIISPFFVGMIADRFFPSQRVLGVMHILGAIFMFGATQTADFGLFYLFILLYNLSFMPTLALTNSLSFNQMKNPEQEFPAVRVLGTLGWIVAGLLIGNLAIEATAQPLLLAAGGAVVMGIFSFFLPHTPPSAKGQKVSVREVLGLDALNLLKRRDFATVVLASVLICIPLAFYYAFANPFLNEIGFENAAGRMTLGQVSEAAFLLVMPLFFARLGVKWMLTIGMGAWAIRYLLFAYGGVEAGSWMLWAGIIMHGICYDFFFVTGQIYVNKEAPAHLKNSVQGLITLATYGLGMFIGSNVSGIIVERYTNGTGHDWTQVWLIPAIFAGAVLLAFILLFRQQKDSMIPEEVAEEA